MGRLSICQQASFRTTLAQDLELYAEQGFNAVGASWKKISDESIEEVNDQLRSRGLGFSSLSWIGGYTCCDGRRLTECLDESFAAIDAAASWGAPCVVVYTGGAGCHTPRHAKELLHLALDSLIPYAEMRRVTLAFKPVTHSRADCSIITNWRDALTLVREVNHSALKLVYDAYYWAVDDKAVDEAAGLVEHLALVQLSDDVSLPSRDEYRRPIGQGNRLLRDLISSLSAAGYDGDYEINLLGSPVAPGIYTEMLTESRAVCNAWFQESNVITA